MLKYQHILWDWNGTLLDDLDLCLETINAMLSRRGLAPLSRQAYRKVFTFPVQDYYREIGFDFEKESFETISTEFILAYEAGRGRCNLMPGAEKTLADLSALGLSQSVISASKQTYLRQAVGSFGLESHFTSVNGLNNHHAASKVELGLAFIAAQKHDPGEYLLVGDTLHDAEVAAAMGVDCCLVPNGHQDRARLAAAGVPLLEDLDYFILYFYDQYGKI